MNESVTQNCIVRRNESERNRLFLEGFSSAENVRRLHIIEIDLSQLMNVIGLKVILSNRQNKKFNKCSLNFQAT